jgi:putative flippase GtrA
MTRVSKRELGAFLVFGCTAVAIDFITYTLLLYFLPHSPAKALSFLAGTLVSYTGNKIWTFQSTSKVRHDLVPFYTLYLCSLAVNVAINKAVLIVEPTWIVPAFLAATGTSTVINFSGQKWWVFKK